MNDSHTAGFAAELLKRSAGGYAAAAAERLLDAIPAARQQGGAFANWRAHLTRRLLELAAAVQAGEPALFSERVRWSRDAFEARQQDAALLRQSLECLRATLQEELPEKAHGVLAYLDAALAALEQAIGEDGQARATINEAALRYLHRILEGDCDTAISGLMAAVGDGSLTVEDVYLDVLLPAQHEIGRLWHAAQVSVAEEHLVTATTQRAMAVLAYNSRRAPPNGATVVAACVVGNAHDMALRALSDLFYLRGWRSIFLGADVPVDDLPGVLSGFSTDLLLLSGTLSTQLEWAERAIQKVRAECPEPPAIIVGGAAFDEAPALAVRYGADAYAATARDALRVGTERLAMRRRAPD